MFGQSLLSAFGSAACTTDTDQLFAVPTSTASLATYELNSNANSIPYNQSVTSIATYQLNNATTSIPSNTYPGTANNITYAAGQFGQAAVFNGSSSRINLSNNPINGLSSVSFSFWIKPLDISSYQYVLSFINAVGGWNGLGVRITNTGKIQLVRANSGAVTTSENSTTSLSLNVWQHIAITVQQSGTVIYINGSEDGTFSNTPFTTNNTGSFDIGMNEYNPGVTQAWMNGSIDQLRIFNSVLPQAAVTALYNETTTTAQYDYVSYPASYNGTPTNITYAAGKFGNAAVFNGINSYVTTPLDFNNLTDYSISMWIYIPATLSNSTFFAGTLNSGSVNGIYFLINTNNTIRWFERSSSASITQITSTDTITVGSWNNIVAVRNGGTNYLYVNNGTPVSASNASITHTTGFTFGRAGAFTTRPLNGKIDQVRIFNTALSQAAITASYNETTTTATYNYVEYESANPNSVAYYKMSDATDQLGNYNGTATNVNFNTEGKFGFAGAFNGSSSTFFLAPAGTSVTNYDSDFSVSMWFNVSSWASGASTDFLWTGGGTRITNLTLTGSNGLMFDLWNSGSNIVSTTGLSENVWYNLVITRSKTAGMVLYINGASVDTNSFTGNAGSLSSQDSLGTYWNNTRNNFTGKIDQVRIYDSALSAANVTTLYNEIECPAVAVTNAFNTVIYNGQATDKTISGVGFQPDLTWVKCRDIVNSHVLSDSVRGGNGTTLYSLFSDLPNAESSSNQIKSFTNDGFELWGDRSAVNRLNQDYVAWNWKAGGTAVSNTDGDNNSAMVSANPDAGFSIITYTGTGTNNSSVGHGLDSKPEMFIYKRFNSSGSWGIVHKDVNNYKAYLSFTTGTPINSTTMNAPTDEVIRFNTTSPTYNGSGQDWLIYAFHSVPGYSKVGSYVGNGSTTGPIVYVGFEPTWLLRKNVTSSTDAHWSIIDNKRNVTTPMNPRFERLLANLANAENTTDINHKCDFNSTSFQPLSNHNITNASGQTYIFLAIA